MRCPLTVKASGLACAAFGLLASGSMTTSAHAASDFYKGKKLKMIIRSGPGGGYDFYGRLIAKHIGNHLPGKPTSIVINMPGGGGVVAANYLMSRARQDGTELAALARELAVAQRTKKKGVKFDVRKLIAIGSPASSMSIIVVGSKVPIKTASELKNSKSVVIFGSSGRGGGSYQRPALFKFDGWPVTIVTGYLGNQERIVGMVRGEIHAMAASYESVQVSLKDGDIRAIGTFGGSHPALKGLENIRPLLSADGRALAALMDAPSAAGRPFFTTPNVPKDRVKLLRAAFKASLSDPALLKEAKKAKRSVTYVSGQRMETIYKDILGASDKVVTTFVSLVSGGDKLSGAIKKVDKGGRVIHVAGKKIRISKSRTKISISKKKASRDDFKVGLKCDVVVATRKGRFEAKSVVCN